MNTLPNTTAEVDDLPGWTISTAAFRLAVDAPLLSPERRAAVRQRPRFHTMPWLVLASPATHPAAADELP